MNQITNCPENDKSHVQWLADWRKAMNGISQTLDESPEEQALHDAAEALSALLAATPATSPADMLAQVAWFRKDLGQ